MARFEYGDNEHAKRKRFTDAAQHVLRAFRTREVHEQRNRAAAVGVEAVQATTADIEVQSDAPERTPIPTPRPHVVVLDGVPLKLR